MRIIGGHVSIAGGIDQAIKRGEQIGATGIQTFASSPRTLQFKQIDEEVVNKYLENKMNSQIEYHVFHGIYLINLASPKEYLIAKGIESLVQYQKLAYQIKAEGTVFHVGSHKGLGLAEVLDGVAEAIGEVLKESPREPWLMLENAAGHNGVIGQNLEELKRIIDAVSKKGVDIHHLGICLDTQHAYASGVDMGDELVLHKLIEGIKKDFGLDKLRLLHVNDSMTDFGSKRDRHENLGMGTIGEKRFKNIFANPELSHLPLILEVPGKDKSGPRKEDVDTLRNWCNEVTR
jgi:deoxyribonuclease-4